MEKGNIEQALQKLDYGAYVVTSRSPSATNGALICLVSQVSFRPPLVMIGVHRRRRLHTVIAEGRVFAVNVLGPDGIVLARHFAQSQGPGLDMFDGVAVEESETGSPLLLDALAYLDCRLVDSFSPGDHTLFIGEVLAAGVRREGRALTIGEAGMYYPGV